MTKLTLVLIVAICGVSRADEHGSCQNRLTNGMPLHRESALRKLDAELPAAVGAEVEKESWFQSLRNFIIPRLDRSDLLVTTIIGGGSGRKSALFSAIESHFTGDPSLRLKDRFSPSSYEGGHTKQMVALLGRAKGAFTKQLERTRKDLEDRFPGLRFRTWDAGSALNPGPGVIAESPHLPDHMMFIDTPGYDVTDFDAAAAEQAVRSSDVLIITIAGMSQHNQLQRDLLKRLFATHGPRRVIFVVTDSSPVLENEIRPSLVRQANDLFGTEGEDFPEGILAAYIMPFNDKAMLDQEHVSLYPLERLKDERFQSFQDVLSDMATDPNGIRGGAFDQVVDVVVKQASARVRSQIRAHLAAQVYQTAARVNIERAIAKVSYHFSADYLLNQLVAGLQKYKGFFGTLEQVYDSTLKAFVDPIELFKSSKESQSIADPQSSPPPVAKFGIAELLKPFRTNIVPPYQVSVEDGQLFKAARTYRRLFGTEDGSAAYTITLPDQSVLNSSAQHVLNALIDGEAALDGDLQDKIETAILDGADPVKNSAGIYQVRQTTSRRRVRGKKALATMISGAALIVFPLSGLMFGLTGLTVEQMFSTKHEKDELVTRATERMTAYLQRTIRDFFTSTASELENDLNEHSKVPMLLDQTQVTLKVLDPSYMVLPNSLENSEESVFKWNL